MPNLSILGTFVSAIEPFKIVRYRLSVCQPLDYHIQQRAQTALVRKSSLGRRLARV
jgi:hypothetical protein